jgi:hypothetical protein
MDKDTIEALRKMQELNYRQLDSSAVVVAEMGAVDYSTNETIRKYTNDGYKLYDTTKFGVGALQCGEFLVFVKKK